MGSCSLCIGWECGELDIFIGSTKRAVALVHRACSQHFVLDPRTHAGSWRSRGRCWHSIGHDFSV